MSKVPSALQAERDCIFDVFRENIVEVAAGNYAPVVRLAFHDSSAYFSRRVVWVDFSHRLAHRGC